MKAAVEGTPGEGVQIKEVDVGRPCDECTNCTNGYAAHKWRSTCVDCKCPRDVHEIVPEQGARARVGLPAPKENSMDARALGYAFVPPGLTTARQVDQYYSSLPSDEVPRLGTTGESLRWRRVVRQLPRHDLSAAACRHLDTVEQAAAFAAFAASRDRAALDVAAAVPAPSGGGPCAACDEPLQAGRPCVAAARLAAHYHPTCFRCTQCEDPLADLAYCAHEGRAYCERHYAEKMHPRCSGCDEVSV